MAGAEEGHGWSDASSDTNEPQSYEVERILYQDDSSPGGTPYLVKWVGYPDYRSTWEPLEHFDTQGLDAQDRTHLS